MTAPPDNYSVASGGTIYGGMAAPWVPPSGYFADVPVTNFPVNIPPLIYAGDSRSMRRAYEDWGGGAWLPDYSPLGAYVLYSAGHENTSGESNIQLTQVLDLSTLTWAIRNVPVSANAASLFQPATGSNLPGWPGPTTAGVPGYAPDNTPYCGHTYMGLQAMPTAWGGGPKGSLVSFFVGGGSWYNRVNLIDVSQATHGYSQLTTVQAAQGANSGFISFGAGATAKSGSYPISVRDWAREGWWLGSGGSNVNYNLFIHKTGAITQYPAVAGGNRQYDSMVLVPSMGAAGLLIGIRNGYDPATATDIGDSTTAYRTISILDIATSAVVNPATVPLVNGTVPAHRIGFTGTTPNFYAPLQLGLQWVEELGAIYGLDDTTDPNNVTVVKLTPPVGNPLTGAWTWSTVPLVHWDAGNPGGQATLQATSSNTALNQVHSKFQWIPTIHAFIYATAANRKPQVLHI